MVDRMWTALQPGRWGWWATVAVAVAALVVIGLQPTVLRQSAPRVTVLLTPGVNKAGIDRAIDSLNPGQVVQTPGVPDELDYPVVRDLQQLMTRFPHTESVVVLGWGLEQALLDSVPVPLTARPTPPPPGIVAEYPGTVSFGRMVHVTGRTVGVRAGATVVLRGPLGTADSTVTDDAGTFALSYRPRASGPMNLELTVFGDTSINEQVAIQVVDPPPSRVLIMDASPSFELSSLRGWLAEGDVSVVHRTAVSSGLFREEFINLREIGTRTITAALLQRFDMVLMDQRSLVTLSRGERQSLRRAVTEDGLGLLILADAGTKTTALDSTDEHFFIDAGWTTFPELEERTVRPQWLDGQGPPSVPLLSGPAILDERFGQSAVVLDGTGGVLAQVAARGAGKIGLLAGLQTVRWQRHGMNDAYAALWAELLSHVTRDPTSVARWRFASGLPAAVDEEFQLEGRTEEQSSHVAIATPSGAVDSVFLAGGTDTPWRRGSYWPRDAGWHRMATSSGEQLFFVHAANAWRAAGAIRRTDATERAALHSAAASSATTRMAARPVPLGWIYGMFLVAVGLLWLADDRGREKKGLRD